MSAQAIVLETLAVIVLLIALSVPIIGLHQRHRDRNTPDPAWRPTGIGPSSQSWDISRAHLDARAMPRTLAAVQFYEKRKSEEAKRIAAESESTRSNVIRMWRNL